MNAEHINPFIQGAQNILATVCASNTSLGGLFLKKTPYQCESVAISIGIFGDIVGRVVFTMKKEVACSLASKMMFGMPVVELDEMAASAISELGNMISGNVATIFSGKGKIVDITPPTFKLNSRADDYPDLIAASNIVCVPLKFEDESVFEIDIFING